MVSGVFIISVEVFELQIFCLQNGDVMDHIKNLSEDEAWEYCIREYETSNPLIRYLIDNFFSAIKLISSRWTDSSNVLELGCGAARSSLILHDMLKPINFEASENDPRYVQRLQREALPFMVTQESAYNLKRMDKSFDHIIMLEVLEHLENPREALKEISRVAKKSFVVSVPNEPLWCILNFARGKYWSSYGNTPGHINHWSKKSLKSLLSEFGEVKVVKAPIPWLIAEVIPC
jgi:ubiquinone/menaquinone biosynthesis C-methylase UbiE